MKVTNFSTTFREETTVFSADFVFSQRFGSLSRQRIFRLQKILFQTLSLGQRGRFFVRNNIWFEVPRNFAVRGQFHEAFFLIAVGMAVFLEEDLDFEGQISAELGQKIPALRQYFLYAHTKREMKVAYKRKLAVSKKKQNVTSQFFTLGLDSFFTLLCNPRLPQPGDRPLIYVEGYDVPIKKNFFLNKVRREISRVAAETGQSPIFIRTNLRDITDQIIGWGQLHVAALAAVAYLLPFRKTLISGESFDFQDWGLRSGVDTLLSTKHTRLSLVAHNISRHKKMTRLKNSPFFELLLSTIRVCWQNVTWFLIPYNCSACQKCLKTQLSLLCLGVATSPTFSKIKLKSLEKIWLPVHVREEWRELYEFLQQTPAVDPRLLLTVKKLLQKHRC